MKLGLGPQKFVAGLSILASTGTAWAQLGNNSRIDTSSILPDVKTVIYELPYVAGKKVSIAQGYNGLWSHKGENALDFLMRKGQIICAARDGIVTGTRSDSKKGGPSYKFINDGNYVIIKHHDDSTSAAYWHLDYNSVFVKPGDTVKAGQPIGKVGSTGFSSGPHLHFEVYYYDRNGKYHSIKTHFNTTRGLKVPRNWHFYRRPKT